MPDENEQLKSALFSNPLLQSQAVDLLVRKRPIGWGRRSVAPYYNEACGKQLKAVLDDMIKTREDQCFYYDIFLKKFGINKDTLYLRVNQSMRWVIEMMDDAEHTYGRFCQMLEVRKKPGVGVILRFRPEHREGHILDFKPKAVDNSEDVPLWKEKLDAWLESSTPEDAPFFKEGLALTRDEILQLENSFKTVTGIMFNVTSFSIKVIKVNE